MSKYIRTKDGIHLRKIFDKECSDEEWKSLGYTIIKQADNIEELCDVFVYTDKYGNHEIIYGNISQKQKRVQELKNMGLNIVDDDIYGAIWTDKGLIYVAKMNAKGEMELI